MRILILGLVVSLPVLPSSPSRGESVGRPYTSVNAIEDLGPNKSGVGLTRKLTATQARALRTVTYSAETKKVYELANDTVRELDFDRLLDSSHATRLKDGTFVFPFHSSMDAGPYKVSFMRKPIWNKSVDGFFDSVFQFGVKENPSIKTDPERGYGVTSEGLLVVDEFDHQFMGRLAKNNLLVLDPSNLKLLKPGSSDVFAGVTGLARDYVNDLARTLPASLDFADALIDPEIKLKPIVQNNDEHMDVLIRAKLDLQHLKRKYRHLGDHVEQMMKDLSFVSSSVLRTADNLVLLKGSFNLAENKFEIRFRTYRGLIVPVTSNGEAVLVKGIDLAKIRSFSGKIVTSFRAKVYGLTIENKDIESTLEYDGGDKAVIRSKLVKVPVAKFRGGLFGIFSPDFLDIMMPGSLEGYAKIFGDGLVRGNGGKGAFAEIRFDSDGQSKSTMRWRVTAELKDDFFLNFGLRILNDYLWPSDETLSDIRNLSSHIAACLDRDIQNLDTKPRKELVSH